MGPTVSGPCWAVVPFAEFSPLVRLFVSWCAAGVGFSVMWWLVAIIFGEYERPGSSLPPPFAPADSNKEVAP